MPILGEAQSVDQKSNTVVCLLLGRSNYDRKKKDTVVWPSFVALFQLPLLRRSNYDRKKKIQSSDRCYAVPITTGKKDTVIWPSFVALFQLPLLRRSNYDQKKKDTVVCPLLRHSKYDRRKKQTWKKLFMRRRTSLSIVVAPFP